MVKRIQSEDAQYTFSYFREDMPLGAALEHGTTNENLEHLTLPDESVDIFITQDVMEHIYRRPIRRTLDFIHMGDDLAIGMTYIRQNTQYDERLIWQHVLRRFNIADIHDTLHLDYVVSDKVRECNPCSTEKVLVLFHLYYLDLLEEEISYLAAIPTYIDVLITTMSENQKKK